MKIKKIQSACLILSCIIATGLIGCGKTNETLKKHEAVTFMAPYLDVDSFIEEVHKTYPEVNLEVITYSGSNTTTYLQNMLEADDLPDICTQYEDVGKNDKKHKIRWWGYRNSGH